ncbi:MAG: hypothetical protein HOH19_00795 [Kordiimonadaceae bacterium]|jgi:hypothetical protein|nr:hypothetical protein [Kordiimonadaceae bacterium]MBT6031086.1 hypothetical protein [Kordiimonadaceae bacterium]
MKYLIIIFSVFTLTGCVTGPYHASNTIGNGYSSELVSENIYHVRYSGTSFEKNDDLVLLRAAEIALEQGYDFFTIMNSKNNSREVRAITYRGVDTRTKAKSDLRIKLLKEKVDETSYDAAEIERFYKDKYDISLSDVKGV